MAHCLKPCDEKAFLLELTSPGPIKIQIKRAITLI